MNKQDIQAEFVQVRDNFKQYVHSNPESAFVWGFVLGILLMLTAGVTLPILFVCASLAAVYWFLAEDAPTDALSDAAPDSQDRGAKHIPAEAELVQASSETRKTPHIVADSEKDSSSREPGGRGSTSKQRKTPKRAVGKEQKSNKVAGSSAKKSTAKKSAAKKKAGKSKNSAASSKKAAGKKKSPGKSTTAKKNSSRNTGK